MHNLEYTLEFGMQAIFCRTLVAMKGKFTSQIAGVLALLGASMVANATTLTLAANVDNVFTAYVSTSPTVDGTLFDSGASWPTTFTGSIALTAGVTNYLHVKAIDQGPPAMFIGEATLSDANAWFDNGTQSALTGGANTWTVSNVGFGGLTESVIDEGPNGTGPWGTRTGVSNAARYIWGSTASFNDPLYFTLKVNTQAAPEPCTLVGLALAGVAVIKRRRR